MIIFWKASLPIALCPDPDFAAASFVRDAVYVYHPATAKLSKEWPQCSFLLPSRQWGRIACEDGHEKSQSSRTTDAMLTTLCCCWRGLLSGPSGGDTILYPRVARGRPVSTTGHRQPISVVAAAPQPPHTAHVISVIILMHILILPPHLSPGYDRGCQYGISNENSTYSY